MSIWLIRSGSNGERETFALDNNVAVIGWGDLPDLSNIDTREKLLDQLFESYPDTKPRARTNWRSQIWPFIHTIQIGDIVAMPLKHRPAVAFGKVTDKYKFDPEAAYDAKHQLPVEWIKEIPRDNIAQDLKYSMGAFMTVCKIWRNDAENRILALVAGKPDPFLTPGAKPTASEEADGIELDEEVDIEGLAQDSIRQLINAQFKGHGLARIVGAVLEAQGYQTTVSPAGADGGVDVIAGSGPLGFGSPRLIVQVKSDQGPVDVSVIRELQGVLRHFGADHALLVAWGGFKKSVVREAARQFFEIRLWTGDDLVQQVLENYDSLNPDIRAELPLKRIWTLAVKES